MKPYVYYAIAAVLFVSGIAAFGRAVSLIGQEPPAQSVPAPMPPAGYAAAPLLSDGPVGDTATGYEDAGRNVCTVTAKIDLGDKPREVARVAAAGFAGVGMGPRKTWRVWHSSRGDDAGASADYTQAIADRATDEEWWLERDVKPARARYWYVSLSIEYMSPVGVTLSDVRLLDAGGKAITPRGIAYRRGVVMED